MGSVAASRLRSLADLGAEEGLRIDRHRAGGPEGAVAPATRARDGEPRQSGLDRRGITVGDFRDGVGEGTEAHVAFDTVVERIDKRGELVAGGGRTDNLRPQS